MNKLSVITVVLNDPVGLEKTILSVIEQRKYFSNIEYIIVDGGSDDNTMLILDKYKNHISHCTSEPDFGIYDAMNKGIDVASGDALLFLNAGDYFVGQVLGPEICAPSFLKVCYIDLLGRFKTRTIDNVKLGIPNCHQGIIFEASNIRYDLAYSISADYKFFLDHGYSNQLPFSRDFGGYVYFDNCGVNGRRYIQRDAEIFKIRREYFGIVSAILYESWPFLKRVFRFIHGKISLH